MSKDYYPKEKHFAGFYATDASINKRIQALADSTGLTKTKIKEAVVQLGLAAYEKEING